MSRILTPLFAAFVFAFTATLAQAAAVTSISGLAGAVVHVTMTDQNGNVLAASAVTCAKTWNAYGTAAGYPATVAADTTTSNAAFNFTFTQPSGGGIYGFNCTETDGGGATGSLGVQGLSSVTSIKFTSP
jgi:hypothetical protein